MNDINLNNAMAMLDQALNTLHEAERKIRHSRVQIIAAEGPKEEPQPEAYAVEIHDNQEYQRGRRDAFNEVLRFVADWIADRADEPVSASQLAADIRLELIGPDDSMSQPRAKRFPWKILPTPESNAGPALTDEELEALLNDPS